MFMSFSILTRNVGAVLHSSRPHLQTTFNVPKPISTPLYMTLESALTLIPAPNPVSMPFTPFTLIAYVPIPSFGHALFQTPLAMQPYALSIP